MHLSKSIYEILRDEKIGLISTLPCNKLADLIRNIPEGFIHIPLSREENGVGISAGFYLTGGKPLMMIQSSGLGNSLNALMSLHKGFHLPLPILASWRGRENDKHKTQIPFGKSLPELFRILELPYTVIERADQIKEISKAIRHSFTNNTPHIILISPEVWETNTDETGPPIWGARKRITELTFKGRFADPELTRHDAILAISKLFNDSIAITTIGRTCPELYYVKDRDLNFYVLAAMGQASPVGLGMAVNTPQKVLVLDGDGSLLKNPNILAEISLMKPSNLTIIALDNGTYSTTGEQKIPSFDRLDLELIARSFGIANTQKAFTEGEIREALEGFKDGPNFLHVIIKPGSSNIGSVPIEEQKLKERFMNAISQRNAKGLGLKVGK